MKSGKRYGRIVKRIKGNYEMEGMVTEKRKDSRGGGRVYIWSMSRLAILRESSASLDSGVSFNRITLVRFLKKLNESITVTIVSV